MKGRFVGRLEKIINGMKKVGKKAIAPILIPMMLATPVLAGRMRIYNRSDALDDSSMNILYTEDSNEGSDGEDVPWPPSPDKDLQIYSVNNNCDPNKLKDDSRGPDSTTTFNLDLYKNGTSSGDNYLRFRMYDSNDFDWKNVFLGDEGDSNDIVADIKYVISSDGGTYGSDGTPYGDFNLPDVNETDTGVYDKRKTFFFNHADLNRDRKVNGFDWAIFSWNWGRTGIVKGSDPNNLDDYADIENLYDVNGVMVSYGNGTADFNDLGLFLNEWLWDADDPNTW